MPPSNKPRWERYTHKTRMLICMDANVPDYLAEYRWSELNKRTKAKLKKHFPKKG